MNPHDNSRLTHRQKEQVQSAHHQKGTETTPSATAEFGTPDEMLRYDAAQTEVPSGLVERLQESIRKEPPAPRGWWRRLFGSQR